MIKGPDMHSRRNLNAACGALLILALTGCSLSTTASSGTTSVAVPGVQIEGRAHGGQQPISGAKVYLLEAGTSGYGSASKSLLTAATGSTPDSIGYYVISGSYGQFSISNDYTCDAGSEVYLYVLGGNSGGGANPGIGLMSVLGQCPSSAPYNFAGTVPFLYVNEVSTVAAAYAIAGFAVDAIHVSAPSADTTNHPAAATGIANAFATANNLFNVATGEAYSSTPAGNGTVPQSRLNTVANIIAACVNTNSFTSGPCSTLTTYARSGGSSGTAPSDTATAAINIAHNPAANVSLLYANAMATSPFMPYLSSAPNDYTLTVIYTGGGLTPANSLSHEPHSIAVDGQGNVWAAGGKHTSNLSEFSPLGVPSSHASKSDYATNIAIDEGSANIWTSNYGFSTASYVKYVIGTGASTQYTPSALSSNDTPSDIAVDESGNVWIADESDSNSSSGNGALLEINAATGAISQDWYSNSANGANNPWALAFQPGASGNLWVADEAGNGGVSGVAVYTPSGATAATYTAGGLRNPLGIAIDSNGVGWIANATGPSTGSVSKITTSGVGAQYTVGNAPYDSGSIAIDGSNNVWIAGQGTSSGILYELSNSGAALSPNAGFTLVNASGGTATYPQSVAIDNAGNVWYNSSTDSAIRQIIGAAAPVATPLSFATAHSLLGQTP